MVTTIPAGPQDKAGFELEELESTLPGLASTLVEACPGLTTEPEVQFSHFQVCQRQTQVRM